MFNVKIATMLTSVYKLHFSDTYNYKLTITLAKLKKSMQFVSKISLNLVDLSNEIIFRNWLSVAEMNRSNDLINTIGALLNLKGYWGCEFTIKCSEFSFSELLKGHGLKKVLYQR